MPLITPEQYVQKREAYSYSDPTINFTIVQTGDLPYEGYIQGIFPRAVPYTHPYGINLRKFELICQSVFTSGCQADAKGVLTPEHVANIQSVALAIVHWKMASQGGRAVRACNNVRAKWQGNTHIELLNAYQTSSLGEFRIGGVRIPTASAFLRFLRPTQFGIIDRRVVNNHTQPAGVTTMSLRNSDGYINDVSQNIEKYQTEYSLFLRREADFLVGKNITFNDVDEHGRPYVSAFRPCDIEMALF